DSSHEEKALARRKKEGGGSNVFSMFEQSQIQEFKEAFTIMDQNRDGFIDKADLRDTFAALGEKPEELEAMIKEAPGAINFTVFLTMFGEKLKGTDPEEIILNAFRVFDQEGKGFIKSIEFGTEVEMDEMQGKDCQGGGGIAAAAVQICGGETGRLQGKD
uniref:Myosin light chain 10 n=1 Tax=Varanus komodoensis TaxID=61221 RepID=A0A8D2LKW0_VARKO